jgi:hypothetical protein
VLAIVVAVAVFGFLTVLAAAALLIGRHGVAVAASIGRNVVLPAPPRFLGPASATPSFRYFASGPSFSFQNAGPFAAFALLAVDIVVVGLAIVYRTSWFRSESKRRLW